MSKNPPRQRIETIKDWLTTIEAFKLKKSKNKRSERKEVETSSGRRRSPKIHEHRESPSIDVRAVKS